MLNKYIFIAVIIGSILLMLSCAKETSEEDISAPASPQMIDKSVEWAQLEAGIDAVPEGDWIYLEWEANQEEDLEGYQIWRMAEEDTAETYTLLEILPLSQLMEPEAPEYTDMSPEAAPDPQTGEGRGYYYYLTAYDQTGNQSLPSDTVYYKLMRKPIAVNIAVNLDTIRWSYPYNLDYDVDFAIRVFRADNGYYIWSVKYSGGQDPYAVKFNYNGSANYMGMGDYLLRVDIMPKFILEEKYSGAESNYYYFTVE